MKLELNQLTKKYKNNVAIEQVSFTFFAGIYGILGANGAGKSTLMKMMSTILAPTEGKILWEDKDIFDDTTDYRGVLGVLPQNFGYYDDFTVKAFLEFMAVVKGVKKTDIKESIQYVLKATNLQKKAKEKMKSLSGGMKQRVGIAQALINDPKILILDEPTVGLDPEERGRFRQILASIGRDRIVILSTHIVQDVEYVADKLLILKEGKILHEGKLEEILSAIDGKVWECETITIDKNKVILCNTRFDNGHYLNRVISDTSPSREAKIVKPTLDDLYLYYFNDETKAEEDN
ncbi:ABC transporter ATP-binding protein [Velocimicrobium porci]|uniref:ABC transporter ATP-binding protein n=1 Tax=Velocimicrobium porci TaxID=2606634 RepID=A0A6L5Y1V9_9FIRM|nr:ABC transporter ATP-binding protein [Velocimicrobium porci]MSS64721.1 ABC transporter ATP-binding protein [Velocimicrobium porci]